MTEVNEFGQPVGDVVRDWSPAQRPAAGTLRGRYCTLEHLEPARHADDLYDAYAAAPDARDWTYLGVGPFTAREDYRDWAQGAASSMDPWHYAVVDNSTGRALGTLALMRQDPTNGVIEVGWVTFSRALQRTWASTEAHYLLMRYVFDELGYRRYEWKCDSLNAPSRKAAARLGFSYEGTFRQAVVVKGRSRDTAWFSLTDGEWPGVRAGFEAWLDPGNADDGGRQLSPLRTRA
ncbi:GNAT family N-acetyltransferase [Ruania rhizosphaerae]|uniref:GNAT family N-acetyltransferase n=1 Tax=Ruania rhizosphaerae TaxID=1840413 RepID=UPI00135B6F65|nr:GNAT family protein [Ruania rhizosphaerae]